MYRNSQKRPTQQSQQSVTRGPPVCPQPTITLLTPPVRGTREYTVDDSESGDDQHHTSTSLHTTTKQLTQTDTQDHTTTEVRQFELKLTSNTWFQVYSCSLCRFSLVVYVYLHACIYIFTAL